MAGVNMALRRSVMERIGVYYPALDAGTDARPGAMPTCSATYCHWLPHYP
ncbi:hypothetical protein V8J36_18825 [Frigidibacter sp. MR17.14]